MRIPGIEILRRFWLAGFIVASMAYAGIYLSHEASRIDRITRFSGVALTLTVVAQCLFWLLASVLWQRLVKRSAAHEIGLFNSFSQLCIVNLGKYVPGKVWGMLARGFHLRDRHKVPVEQTISATALEQYFLLYAAAVVVFLGSPFFFDEALRWLGVALGILAVLLVVPVSHVIMRFADEIRLRFFGGKATKHMPAQLSVRLHYQYLFGYVVIWLLLGTVLFGLAHTFFQSSFSLVMFLAVVVAATAGYVAGFVAVFAPGGIGVREAVVSATLVSVMPLNDAILLSLLFRLWTVVTDGLAGVFVLLSTRRHQRSS